MRGRRINGAGDYKTLDLLTYLKEKNDYVSGQEIAGAMGISRNAVWKQIERLRGEGVQVEAVTGKGYRVADESDAFGEKSIRSYLHTKWLGHELLFFNETDSTNDELKRRAGKGAKEGLIAIADRQTKGKGRRGRGWETPAGVNIAMSYLLRPDFSPDIAPMMTLIMAMAAAKGIREESSLDVGIKWPNDIVVNGKKLVGILTEMSAEPDYIHEVIIGTGINVNNESFPEEIRNTATSMLIEGGRSYSRAKVAASVTDAFEGYYETFHRTGDLRALRQEYDGLCVNTGARVRILDPKGEYDATAHGIDDKGELIVTKDDGTEEHVYAGEVSVRGIYGYV